MQGFVVFLDDLLEGLVHELVADLLDGEASPVDLFPGPLNHLLVDKARVGVLGDRVQKGSVVEILRFLQHSQTLLVV